MDVMRDANQLTDIIIIDGSKLVNIIPDIVELVNLIPDISEQVNKSLMPVS